MFGLLIFIIIITIGVGVYYGRQDKGKKYNYRERKPRGKNDECYSNYYERVDLDDNPDDTLISSREKIRHLRATDPKFAKDHEWMSEREIQGYGFDEDDPDDWS